MSKCRAYRWSDNDRYWGRFTYAKESGGGYRPLAVVLSSPDDEDAPCRLRLAAFGHTLIVRLPTIIKPERAWVDLSKYDWASDRKGYWAIRTREYGFSVSDGHLSVFHGRQTHDSSTEQRWGCFLPWTQWRHVRHSFYDLAGQLWWTMPQHSGRGLRGDWEVSRAVEDRCPAAVFAFHDFDGEALTVRTKIEEREWLFGAGAFKWLSLFRKPKISRVLYLTFSGETGKRKGSWKGGTIGRSIELEPGELHESGFRRYCAQNGMTFKGAA